MIDINDVDAKAIRERLGLTQEEFAENFGFSIQSLKSWEQGIWMPTPVALYLCMIARFPDEVKKEVAIRRIEAGSEL